MKVSIVIPALNEEASIGQVIAGLPRDLVHEIIVADNGSEDRTAEIAAVNGAKVVRADRRGYGSACLAGIAASDHPDIIAFIDGDLSDYPEDLPNLIMPIEIDDAELVIGSRTIGQVEPGSLTQQQKYGNWLATRLIWLFFGVKFTDLGPFRAITREALERIRMEDTNYGWTVEMQVKAAQHNLRCVEVPVRYRKRIGVSKISGTWTGTLSAGYKILYTIFRYALKSPKRD